MPHNRSEVWDGIIRDPERNYALLTGEASPNGQDLRAVVSEVIATQEGLTIAGHAVQALQGRVAELQSQLDTDSQQILTAAIEAQQAFVAASEKTQASLAALCEQLGQTAGTEALAGQFTQASEQLNRTNATLAANSKATLNAIQALANHLKARDEFLADFADFEHARYWVTQARRFLGFLNNTAGFADPYFPTPDRTQ